MNHLPNDEDSTTLAYLQRIDVPCLRFEDEWRAGKRPDVNAYLHQAREEDRPGFLRELLRVEWTYRSNRKESIDLSDYARRFEKWPDVVQQSWQRWQQREGSVYNTVEPTGGVGNNTVEPTGGVVNPQEVARALVGMPGYEQYTFLGAGGMAEVWKAWQPEMKRFVALKQMLTGQATTERRARFHKEMETLAQLRHPHIVQLHGYHDREGSPVQVMEYVSGGTLEDRLEGQIILPMEAAKLVAILAWAVQAAHEKGIVHRDLKPANVLMDAPMQGDPGNVLGGYPKIADFGLASWGEEDQRQTISGMVMGTPAYMSPEQAAGQNAEVGPPTDVWALGVILYRCLTGVLPFKGDTVLATLEMVRTMQFKPLREVSPDVPAKLAAVCMRCLAKELKERPTAVELAGLLEGVAAGGEGRGKTAVVEQVSPAKEERWRGVGWWTWAHQPRYQIAAGVVAASLLGVLLTGWLMSGNKKEGQAAREEVLEPAKVEVGQEAVRVVKWNVEHYEPEGVGKDHLVGVIGTNTAMTRYMDKLIVEVELSQPAYCYLVGFNFDGKEQLLLPCDEGNKEYPGDKRRRPEKSAKLCYPPRVEPQQAFELSDDAKGGLQAFLVVASAKPLPPYEEWLKNRGKATWVRLPGGERVWQSNGDKLEPKIPTAGKLRGKVVPLLGLPPLVALCRWARGGEGEVVEAMAFPVNPREDVK